MGGKGSQNFHIDMCITGTGTHTNDRVCVTWNTQFVYCRCTKLCGYGFLPQHLAPQVHNDFYRKLAYTYVYRTRIVRRHTTVVTVNKELADPQTRSRTRTLVASLHLFSSNMWESRAVCTLASWFASTRQNYLRCSSVKMKPLKAILVKFS